MELISVIVPVYRVEEYLDQCVSSIVNQTYPQLEIILVDDGSPDRCGGMCDDWAKKDSRIRVIHKQNGGLSDARNAGMKIAAGAYTAFVDSDDRIAGDFIETLYDALAASGAQIAGCDICTVYSDEEPTPNAGTGELRVYTAEEAISDIQHNRGLRAVAWNKLYLTSLLKGETYPVGKYHEDEFFTYRIFGKAEKLVYVDKPMYFYLQRQGSIMHSFSIKRLDGLEAYLERMDYLKDRYPALYQRDRLCFSMYCALMYCQTLDVQDPSIPAIRRKIKALRRQVRLSPKEFFRASVKQKLYVLGTGLCMRLFCTVLNRRIPEEPAAGSCSG